ncbi:MAG: LuxR family transcriptional regulator, partial [Flavobacteriaceae bacterium]|nr:LuxR family transcriptional regulator [Flavobacteriaceae bacterium]
IEETMRESKMKDLESQKAIIQLKNESLHQDIEARNRELAIATMSMINGKNKLKNIKDAILHIDQSSKNFQPVIKLINDSLDSTEEWKFFEEAFNHADKDFFKRIKKIHPNLTPNDLKLCVYLRLNLSSKEIAPLLNISPRSVEIKRYRLRKKIDLNSKMNLNDYFIKL